MKGERLGHPPRSATEIKRAIASIPVRAVEQIVREAEKELHRKIAEIEKERRRDQHNYVPHRFTI